MHYIIIMQLFYFKSRIGHSHTRTFQMQAATRKHTVAVAITSLKYGDRRGERQHMLAMSRSSLHARKLHILAQACGPKHIASPRATLIQRTHKHTHTLGWFRVGGSSFAGDGRLAVCRFESVLDTLYIRLLGSIPSYVCPSVFLVTFSRCY